MVFSLYDYDDEEEQQFTPTVDFAQDFARQKALDLGLDPELALNLIGTESNWNPEAKGTSGEIGYGQFMEPTARKLGVNRENPLENLEGSLTHFDDLVDKYGPQMGAVGYNAGEGAIKSGRIPASTKEYVSKVTGTPLPDSPSFDSSSRISSLPSPNRRLADLAAAQEEIDGLQGIKSEALGSLGKGSSLTGQEALVTALTALIPTLIGWGSGGMQGAAMGAQAGAAGAGVGLSGFAAEAKEREAANKLAYSDAATQLAAKRGELKGIRDSIADREEKNKELEYMYGAKPGDIGVRTPKYLREQVTQEFKDPLIVSALSKDDRSTWTPAEKTAVLSNPRAAKLAIEIQRANANDTNINSQVGAREMPPEASSALVKAWNGQPLTAEEELAIASNKNSSSAYNDIKRQKGQSDRHADKMDLAGRLPTTVFAKVNGNDIAIQSYQELGRLIQDRDVSPERIAQVMGGVKEELLNRNPKEVFEASGWDGLFDRIMAKSGIEPSSVDAQVLERMKQIGRAIAIAQPGVATNEDALQEVNFVSLKPGQDIQSYLANLTRLTETKVRDLSTTLDNAEIGGYPIAKKFKEKYYSSGIIPNSGAGRSKIKSITINN
jgi:hypothetical protein